MLAMAKKKPKPDSKPKRTGRAITFWLDNATFNAMASMLADLPLEPTTREYITKCIRRDLAERGCWPPAPKPGKSPPPSAN